MNLKSVKPHLHGWGGSTNQESVAIFTLQAGFVISQSPGHLLIDIFSAKFTIGPMLRGRFEVNIKISWGIPVFSLSFIG